MRGYYKKRLEHADVINQINPVNYISIEVILRTSVRSKNKANAAIIKKYRLSVSNYHNTIKNSRKTDKIYRKTINYA